MTDEVGATLPAGARVHDHVIEQWLRAVPDGQVYRVVHAQTGAVACLHEYLPAAWAFRDADGVLAQPGRGREFQVGLRRFLLRGRQLGELHHPALPRVIEAWPSHGTACILTTPVASRTLSDVVHAAGGRIPLEQAWPWLCACCDLAEWLHQQGKIHGAWDPETIGVRDNQELVFPMPEVEGPAHPASGWMPLEQSALAPKGVQRGPWTDVFGIAALAAFLLTGQSPANARRRPAGLAASLTPHAARAPAAQETLPRAMMAAIRVSLLPNARQRPQDIAQLKSMMGLFATAPVLSDEVKSAPRLPLAAPSMVMPRPPASDAPLRAVAGPPRAKLALLKRVDPPASPHVPASGLGTAEGGDVVPVSPAADAPAVRIYAVAPEARPPMPPPTLAAEAPGHTPNRDATPLEPVSVAQAIPAGLTPSALAREPVSTGTPETPAIPGTTVRRKLSSPVVALALGAAVFAVVGLWTSLSVPTMQPAPQLAGDPQTRDIEGLLKEAPAAAGPAAARPAPPAAAETPVAAATASVPAPAPPVAAQPSPAAARSGPAAPVTTAMSAPTLPRASGGTGTKPESAAKTAAAAARAPAERGTARAPEAKSERDRTAQNAPAAKPADSGPGQKLAQAAPRAGASAERRSISCSQVLLEQSLGARVAPADVRNCR